MPESGFLIPIRSSEIAVGQALPKSAYDWHGNLLYEVGMMIDSQALLEKILDSGYFYDGIWEPGQTEKIEFPVDDPKNKPPRQPPKEDDPGKETFANMDDVRWVVGETLYLQLHDNPTVRYTIHLIGYVKNKSLFVTAPALNGKYDAVREGQIFVVRAFSGKRAFAFTAAALKSMHSPHPFLILTYPKQVRCTIIRQNARAQVKIIASVSLTTSAQPSAMTIHDLSLGGASGTMKELLGKKGAEGTIKFKIFVAGQDAYLNLKMILRSVGIAENGEGVKHGLEFIDVPMHEKLILSAYVNQTLAEVD